MHHATLDIGRGITLIFGVATNLLLGGLYIASKLGVAMSTCDQLFQPVVIGAIVTGAVTVITALSTAIVSIIKAKQPPVTRVAIRSGDSVDPTTIPTVSTNGKPPVQ